MKELEWNRKKVELYSLAEVIVNGSGEWRALVFLMHTSDFAFLKFTVWILRPTIAFQFIFFLNPYTNVMGTLGSR